MKKDNRNNQIDEILSELKDISKSLKALSGRTSFIEGIETNVRFPTSQEMNEREKTGIMSTQTLILFITFLAILGSVIADIVLRIKMGC